MLSGSTPRDVDLTYYRTDLSQKVTLMKTCRDSDSRVAPLLFFGKKWSKNRKIGSAMGSG